jgi:hypothetical protein
MQISNTHGSTNTDFSFEWSVHDGVIQLRDWATHHVCPLPLPPVDECWIGTDAACAIRIDDPTGRVGRRHVKLMRRQSTWMLRHGGGKNGFRIDGSLRKVDVVLEPGFEIGIGGLTFVAESARSIAFQRFLARLLGCGPERAEAIDQALRSIRLAAAHRTALVLSGDGDLVPLAGSLHRHARGATRPFIVCDPRRRRGPATVRSAQNYESGMEALAAAAGGSLCVRSRRLPRDFGSVLGAMRSPDCHVQLIVCADRRRDGTRYSDAPIVIPPLSSREAELDSIIDEYAKESMTELRTLRYEFPEVDRLWVRSHAGTSLAEVEKATLRLVALRVSRNLSAAAALLQMAPVSLSRWIGRRALPMPMEQ